ncbi:MULTISPECIES: protein kinase [unclassified Streptomyces]|uniref:serine/threonine-protein kinase n=1 Tax=unclassified Streptomyces TaxID=2593676 RepID=UPI00278BCFDE|nr:MULTISPECIES: serine/threonine-protein kinase [unclassified Streptomyces]
MPSPTALTHDDPAQLGPFRLVARLGSGGMGTVYVARTAGGRTVAVKTMHAALAADPAGRTRFRLEIDAARVIGGQFGAKVVDADPLADTPWLATEYVLGPPLDEAVETGGPLPEATVRALGAALCAALGQLHRSDVVHRDLKPSNILVTAHGPKVIDFGIARAIGDDRLTRTGSAVGTPAFMSPEQATGQEHGPAGDVFALAGVLVYAARGSGPFGNGQAADLLYRVRYGEPDLTGVPAALVPVLAWCLHKDPAQRPTTQQLAAQLHSGDGEFVDQLSATLLGDIGRRAVDVWQIAPQRMPAPPQHTVPQSAATAAIGTADGTASRRRFLAVGGVLGAGAVAGGAAWWWTGRPSGQPEAAADPKPGNADDAGEPAPGQRNLDPLWSESGYFDTSVVKGKTSVPAIVDGTAVAMRGYARGLGATDGKKRWDEHIGSSWNWTAAAGKLYHLSYDVYDDDQAGKPVTLETIAPRTGKRLKALARLDDTTDHLEGNQLLCVTDDIAYVVVGQGKGDTIGYTPAQKWTLRAVDCATGKTVWSRPLPKRDDVDPAMHILAAKVAGGRLVTYQQMKKDEPHIVVRDLKDGRVLWDVPYLVDDIAPLWAEPAVDDTYVYIGGTRLRAVALKDGKARWQTPEKTPEVRAFGPPTLAGGVLYAVVQGTGLTAYQAHTGKRLWSEKGADADEQSTAWRPLVGRTCAYYRNGAQLRAVDLRTRAVVATYKTDGDRFYADPGRTLVLSLSDNSELAAYPMK